MSTPGSSDLQGSSALSGEESGSLVSLADQVARLMKMPQHLCKQRGACCKVATFKGTLTWKEIQVLAASPNAEGHESARDFASVFLPFASQDEARQISDGFVERVRDVVVTRGDDPDAVNFFHCKYVLEDGRCGVHEDRPIGCRVFPLPHKNTIMHPGCGFEQQGVKNWLQIEEIMAALDRLEQSQQQSEPEITS